MNEFLRIVNAHTCSSSYRKLNHLQVLVNVMYGVFWKNSCFCRIRTTHACHYKTLTIFPLSGCWVDDAEQFVVGDGLGVQIDGHGFAALIPVRLVEGSPDLTLADASVTQTEDGVTHLKQLL